MKFAAAACIALTTAAMAQQPFFDRAYEDREFSQKLGPAGAITEYPVETTNPVLNWITTGPDGALWFAENGGNRIGRITTAGVVTGYSVPTVNSGPLAITPGPDR